MESPNHRRPGSPEHQLISNVELWDRWIIAIWGHRSIGWVIIARVRRIDKVRLVRDRLSRAFETSLAADR